MIQCGSFSKGNTVALENFSNFFIGFRMLVNLFSAVLPLSQYLADGYRGAFEALRTFVMIGIEGIGHIFEQGFVANFPAFSIFWISFGTEFFIRLFNVARSILISRAACLVEKNLVQSSLCSAY